VYDLHAHILPGVDDGAKTPEDTVEMAQVASDTGTKIILATPHRKDVTEESSVGHIRELIEDMNGRITDQGNDLKLVLGMENHLDVDLPGEIEAGRALPMNGGRYMLIEMPFFGKPNYIEDVLFKVQLQGITPVLAHPERIEAFQNDVDLLASFVERGMLSQVTAGSVIGYFGKRVQAITNNMLQRNLVHVLASDTHFARGSRSPKLGIGIEAASTFVGEEAALAMVVDTPKAILEDQTFEVARPLESVAVRKWWKFW
jgi:protein-tyrosine phosphatase